MLKVFFGNDTVKVRKEAFAQVEKGRLTGLAVESIDEDNYTSGCLADATGSVSLFGVKTLYVIDTPSSSQELYDAVIENLSAMAESTNEFVIIEGPLLAAEKKKFTKHAESIDEYKAAAETKFNNFSLADALARKDKRSLWLLWHEALLSGAAAPELVGIMWWQLKTLRLAALASSAEEAGLKDYPYSKAKRSLSNFKSGELESISHSLLALLHESRLGLNDLDVAVERWLLKV